MSTDNYASRMLIGRGNTAEIYDLGDGKILKLFHQGFSKWPVMREYQNALVMNQKRLEVPGCHEFVEKDGRFGIVYDKVEGIDLIQHMVQTGQYEQDMRIMVRHQQEMMNRTEPSLISYKEFIRTTLGNRFPPILEQLEQLPEGEYICHGDFHPGNVMITNAGDTKVIDFMNVCRGPKLYDIARSYYLMGASDAGEATSNEAMNEMLKQRKILAEFYLELIGVDKEKLTPFLDVIKICHKCEVGKI